MYQLGFGCIPHKLDAHVQDIGEDMEEQATPSPGDFPGIISPTAIHRITSPVPPPIITSTTSVPAAPGIFSAVNIFLSTEFTISSLIVQDVAPVLQFETAAPKAWMLERVWRRIKSKEVPSESLIMLLFVSH